jgi:hypothetical protein
MELEAKKLIYDLDQATKLIATFSNGGSERLVNSGTAASAAPTASAAITPTAARRFKTKLSRRGLLPQIGILRADLHQSHRP